MKRIVQISDIHCGSGYFDSGLMEKTIEQVNSLKPDILIVTGDLTMEGFYEEFVVAKNYLDRFEVKDRIIVPGNHDARNVGYKTFEKLIGEPFSVIKSDGMIICGADSTEPDLDEGNIGRTHTAELKNLFSGDYSLRILALHHHVISLPNSGREMNILRDAGDVLDMAVKSRVNLILSGHKHIPNLWNFEGIKVLTCATTTSRRVRGLFKPSYHIIDITEKLNIRRKEVEGEEETICDEIL